MTRMPEPLILPIRGHAPLLHAESWVAPNASVIGQVTLAARAVILNGATIGKGCLIAAGALVPQGIAVPPRSLVTGVPGTVRRELTDAEIANNRHNAQVYQRLIDLHRDAVG
jgi:carbonic anhydrase/acetyltransferase-like protein (isoleucine patch superfamily)